MNVLRAQSVGFCMGVALALQKLDKAIEESTHKNAKGRIYTFGPIIHNPQVLQHYSGQGVVCLQDIHAVKAHDIVVIRAHGIPKAEEDILRRCGALIIDATCPKVKKAQLAIAHATQGGINLLLFGERDHPEVRGLISYAAHEAFVFDSLEELCSFELALQHNYVLASQTTQDRHIFDSIEHYLKKNFQNIPVLETICNATRQRQEEAKSIASQTDAMVVVGGKESGNTRRLADVAAAEGIATWHIECVQELCAENFITMRNVGLTAGASTPKNIIDSVHRFLAEI